MADSFNLGDLMDLDFHHPQNDKPKIPPLRNLAGSMFVPLTIDLTKATPPQGRMQRLEHILETIEFHRQGSRENLLYMFDREKQRMINEAQELEKTLNEDYHLGLTLEEENHILASMDAPADPNKDYNVKTEAMPPLLQAIRPEPADKALPIREKTVRDLMFLIENSIGELDRFEAVMKGIKEKYLVYKATGSSTDCGVGQTGAESGDACQSKRERRRSRTDHLLGVPKTALEMAIHVSSSSTQGLSSSKHASPSSNHASKSSKKTPMPSKKTSISSEKASVPSNQASLSSKQTSVSSEKGSMSSTAASASQKPGQGKSENAVQTSNKKPQREGYMSPTLSSSQKERSIKQHLKPVSTLPKPTLTREDRLKSLSLSNDLPQKRPALPLSPHNSDSESSNPRPPPAKKRKPAAPPPASSLALATIFANASNTAAAKKKEYEPLSPRSRREEQDRAWRAAAQERAEPARKEREEQAARGRAPPTGASSTRLVSRTSGERKDGGVYGRRW
ncbi:hypothetical protein B0T21DRAFT_399688 [Apiosordaria backusii]|uniref:Uncharacterized protein n=1 Tax=Apiosordaria backusii TaxID=314023 RepID=A0AA40ELS9_9PEZI|nr:hypothetical protein B0T21DRAFT_399688 [Apiosordaria backusii]